MNFLAKALVFFLLLLQVHTLNSQSDYNKYSQIDLKNDLYPFRKEITESYNLGDIKKIKELYNIINQLENEGKENQAGALLLYMGISEFGINRDTALALKDYKEAEKLFKKTSNLKYLLRTNVQLASLYNASVQADKSIELLLDAIKTADTYPEEKFLAIAQLGSIFKRAKNNSKAFEYLYKANSLFAQLTGVTFETKISYNEVCRNLGVLHRNEKRYDSAEVYFLKAIKGAEEMQIRSQEASNLNSLAVMYVETGKTDLAIKTYEKSIEIKRSLKGKDGAVATSLNNLAGLYIDVKQPEKAIKLLDEALELSTKANDARVRANVLQQFNEYFKLKPNPARQNEMLKELVELQEKIYNSDVTEQMAKMEAVYQNEKKSKEITEANHKNDVLKQDIEYKDRERKIFIIGTILLLALLFVATRMYIEVRKVNKTLNTKNDEINRQKSIVEHQNKEIIDSINYAQRIQSAILPTSSDFIKLVGDSFLLFKPKDIVSGDFYWCCEKNGYIFYATVDCTGHGVPGGFMSMLATSFLAEIVIEKSVLEPAEILNELREKVVSSLKQKGISGENKDGMDMSVCRIDKQKRQLVVGAANNPVWIVRDGDVLVLKADKIPVGYSHSVEQKFSQQTIELQQNDVIYSFTDGYADQFGGPAGKKFKYKQMLDLLRSISNKSMEEQGNILSESFENWRGNLEQLDDICVIGVRV